MKLGHGWVITPILPHAMTDAMIRSDFKYIENDVCTWVTNCFSAQERVILVFMSELRSNEGNKHQNNTWVSAETVHHESTYIISFLTRHNDNKNDDKNDDLHTSTPRLTR